MKKAIISFLIAVFYYVPWSNAQFQFVSPMPGSVMNSMERNIIIRQGSTVDALSVKNEIFTIRGSISGLHKFRTTLCRDSKTILLHPLEPFAPNEEVSVTIRDGLKSVEDRELKGFAFSFTTHRQYTSEETEHFKRMKEILWEQELNQFAYQEDTDSGNESTRNLTGLVTINVNTNPSPGHIFFDASSTSGFPNMWTGYHVISSDGDSIYSQLLAGASDFKMEDNGNFGVHNKVEDRFEVLDSNFHIIKNVHAVNGYYVNNHEMQITPDHYAFIIANEYQIVDMTVYNPNYSPNASVLGSVIQQFDPDNNLIFEWRSFDHIDIDEATQIDLSSNNIDYVHTNSIEVDNDGNLLVSHRHTEQVTKIDINTGDIIWRWGGELNEFTFTNDPDMFSYQHDIRRLPNGNLLMWDNGNFHQPPQSAAKEYQLDEVNMTATLVWSYGHPGTGANDLFYLAGGNAQRLPNGNTFINGGGRSINSNPSMFEVTPNGTIVWELKLESSKAMSAYRAHRYEWDPCARPTFKDMKTKNITSGSAKLKWTTATGAVKYNLQYKKHSDNTWTDKLLGMNKRSFNITGLQSNTKYDWRLEGWCTTSGTEHSGYTEIKKFTTLPQRIELTPDNLLIDISIFPNPAHEQIMIESASAMSNIRILDLTGREVMNFDLGDKGISSLPIPIQMLPGGNYFVEIISMQNQEVIKLIVQK